jgi:hypothetical protein
LTIDETARVAYDAGFRTEQQLVAIVSIAIAESSLVPNQRHWHPEYGYRPQTDVIGVEGPPWAWNATHTLQLHSDRGIFQISSRSWPQYTDALCDNPAEAAKVAFTISGHGRDFSLWDVHKSQLAQAHYDRATNGWPAVRPVIQQFLLRVTAS